MAVKKKVNSKLKKRSSENYFSISSDKKKKIVGILLILLSVFLLLSIISFDRRDEANLTGFFTTSSETAEINNWGGTIGANTATFFIKSTIGYFSLVFSFLLFVWGISFFKQISPRVLVHISNFMLLSGIFTASFFGVFRTHYNVFSSSYELSGYVGDYIGKNLSNLVGGLVGILLIITAMIVLLIFAFDIKIEKIFSFLKELYNSLRSGKKAVKFASSLLSNDIMLSNKKTESSIKRIPTIFFFLSE